MACPLCCHTAARSPSLLLRCSHRRSALRSPTAGAGWSPWTRANPLHPFGQSYTCPMGRLGLSQREKFVRTGQSHVATGRRSVRVRGLALVTRRNFNVGDCADGCLRSPAPRRTTTALPAEKRSKGIGEEGGMLHETLSWGNSNWPSVSGSQTQIQLDRGPRGRQSRTTESRACIPNAGQPAAKKGSQTCAHGSDFHGLVYWMLSRLCYQGYHLNRKSNLKSYSQGMRGSTPSDARRSGRSS